jgi:hypothetical protein
MKLLSIEQILTKESHERTAAEQEVAIAINMAKNRTRNWKNSGQPRINGVLADILRAKKLPFFPGELEQDSLDYSRICLEKLLEYYSSKGKEPLEEKALKIIFGFTKRNLHPSYREGFGYFVLKIGGEKKIPLTAKADILAHRLEIGFVKRSTKEAVHGVQGAELKKIKNTKAVNATSAKHDAIPTAKFFSITTPAPNSTTPARRKPIQRRRF